MRESTLPPTFWTLWQNKRQTKTNGKEEASKKKRSRIWRIIIISWWEPTRSRNIQIRQRTMVMIPTVFYCKREITIRCPFFFVGLTLPNGRHVLLWVSSRMSDSSYTSLWTNLLKIRPLSEKPPRSHWEVLFLRMTASIFLSRDHTKTSTGWGISNSCIEV
jgi:hypothetical protein